MAAIILDGFNRTALDYSIGGRGLGGITIGHHYECFTVYLNYVADVLGFNQSTQFGF